MDQQQNKKARLNVKSIKTQNTDRPGNARQSPKKNLQNQTPWSVRFTLRHVFTPPFPPSFPAQLCAVLLDSQGYYSSVNTLSCVRVITDLGAYPGSVRHQAGSQTGKKCQSILANINIHSVIHVFIQLEYAFYHAQIQILVIKRWSGEKEHVKNLKKACAHFIGCYRYC